MSPAVQRLTEEFIATIEAVVAERVNTRLRDVVAIGMIKVPKVRRKAPVQLCPAPGCANRAAPVFGMVCASHKDTAKATVRAWREKRRAAKGR